MKLGVFTEDENIYHAEKEYISSTPLREMDRSPAHFYAAWKLRKETEATPAQATGKCLHALLLEQNIEKFVARPLNDKGDLVRSNSKEYAAFEAANPGKTAIHPDLYKELYSALSAFAEHKTAMKMIKDAKIEQSVYAQDKETGLYIKARPDIWGSGYIADLKSTSELNNFFERYIYSADFPMQLAHYAETIKAATGEEIKSHYILGFETTAPFGIKIYRIPLSEIMESTDKRRAWLNEISVCQKENKWPSYREEIIEPIKPKFMEKTLEGFEVAI